MKISSSCAPERASSATSIDSSLNAIDRLSKFIVPTPPHMPSTTIVFACIIAGWYS